MAAPIAIHSLLDLARQLPEFALDIVRGQTERARTQRNAVLAFAIRVASAGMLYLSQIFLARWMGGFEYGIYVYVWTWVLVLGGLSHAGLGLAMIKLVPQYRETGEFGLLRGVLLGGRLFAVSLATVIAGAGMLALWAFQDVFAHYTLVPLFLALVCIPLYTLSDFQDGVGRGHAWMITALFPPYVLRPFLVLLVMVAAWLLGFEMSAPTAVGAAIIATWSAAIVQTIVLHRKLKETVPAVQRKYDFRAWFTIALPLLVISICEMLLQNADVLIISRYVEPTQVGIYFAAAKTMSLILFVHFAVASAVANRYSALHARGDEHELKELVRDAANWTFWPSLAAAIAILALGQPLLSLFGAQFTEGYPVMFVLVLGFLTRSAVGPAEYLLSMLGEQSRCAFALGVGAALSVILNFVLTPQFGIMGAASATAIAIASAALLNCWFAWSRLGLAVGIWSNLPIRKSQTR